METWCRVPGLRAPWQLISVPPPLFLHEQSDGLPGHGKCGLNLDIKWPRLHVRRWHEVSWRPYVCVKETEEHMGRMAAFTLCLTLACSGLETGWCWAETEISTRNVMGWIEYVVIEPWGVRVKAKLDSGAKTSSVYADDITHFEKDGKNWVRFTVAFKRKNTDEIQRMMVERPLVRNVRIKRHGHFHEERPVVTMRFCLNGESHEAEFTLANRKHFLYPVLLGRHFLKDVALIDPAANFLTNSKCKISKKKSAAKKRTKGKPDTGTEKDS